MANSILPKDDDDREPARLDIPAKPVMRVDLEVPDGVHLMLVINGVEMDLDD
jgi:hypothetical protein